MAWAAPGARGAADGNRWYSTRMFGTWPAGKLSG